jgi:hypothetical protein
VKNYDRSNHPIAVAVVNKKIVRKI